MKQDELEAILLEIALGTYIKNFNKTLTYKAWQNQIYFVYLHVIKREINLKPYIMLKIGFASKYFTLWDVSTWTEYGQGTTGTYSYQKTLYTYYRNLSINEDKALEKAKKAGVKDLTVDTELFGRSGRSFYKVSPREYVKYEDTQFSYGKYCGEYFSKCEDTGYLQWYFRDNGNIKAAERLVELDDYFVIENGELINQDILENRNRAKMLENVLKTQGFIDVFVDRNVDEYGFLNVVGVKFHFNNIKLNWYKDWSYYRPVLKGKAKLIKNKNVRIYAELGIVCSPIGDIEAYMVSDFKVIK